MFTSIDTTDFLMENLPPVPLKHFTETAYMLVLGIAICVAGFAASLLPAMPVGTKYWAILLTLSVLYPLALSRTFKSNRADYEFRLLHWFPAGIFLVWFLLQLVAPRFAFLRILSLGFFFLWSLPLVALGIVFIIIFAVHVLRRRRVRVTFLLLFLGLFTAGAMYAQATNENPRLQALLYPKELPSAASLRVAFATLRESLGMKSGSSALLVARTSQSSSGGVSSSTRSRGALAVVSSSDSSSASSIRSSLPPVITQKKPARLPQSGPESVALIGATLLALYFGVLHARAKKRV